ncbi:rho GTPase-activating protein 18-like [Ornithodoros turicata]
MSKHFADYWSECDQLRPVADDDEAATRPSDDEADWLRDAGFAFALPDDVFDTVAADEPRGTHVRTLTREQASALSRRLNQVHGRHRPHKRREDVRDVFSHNVEDRPPIGLPKEHRFRKSHWHELNDTVASLEVKGVQVIGYRGKEQQQEEPISIFDDWTMQPGFDVNFRLTSHDQELPLVSLTENPAGVTRLGHLSPRDQRTVTSLTLMELSALYDQHGLTYCRRKPTRRKATKDSHVLGVPLTTLLEQDAQRGFRGEKPWIIGQILEYLERRGLQEEGILRVSGAAARIDALKADLETYYVRSPEKLPLVLERYGPHEVAALLKQILRSLPEPLLTYKYMEAFLQVPQLPTLLNQLKALNLLVLLLPAPKRETLLAIVKFLDAVTRMEWKNRMSLLNVSMIMAPNLFTPKQHKATEDNLRLARLTTLITSMLVCYQHLLWNVPSQFIDQIRLEYKMEKKHKSKKKEQHVKVGELRIAVDSQVRPDAPVYTVRVDDATTAGSVVREVFLAMRFEERRKDILNSVSGEEAGDVETFARQHSLFEVGGTIGWRQLECTANVMSVFQENPMAEWHIRPRHTS